MATRFYFPGNLVAAIEPDFAADWHFQSDYPAAPHARSVRQMLGTAKGVVQGVVEYSCWTESLSASPSNFLVRQFISGPLAAQTLSGTVKGQICAYQQTDSGTDTFCRAIIVRVVSNDGATVRGTLLAHLPDPLVSKFPYFEEPDPGIPENRYFPPSATALTEVVCESGDRLVIELGGRYIGSTSEPYAEAFLYLGNNAENDLPEDEAETSYATKVPWIEFSMDIELSVTGDDFTAAGGWSLTGPGVFVCDTDLNPTRLATDGFIELSGDCEIESIPPTQFLSRGYIGLSGLSVIDSTQPGTTHLVAAGSVEFSGASVLASAPPDNGLVTVFVADGCMNLSSRCVLGDERDLPGRTDFVAAGGYVFSGNSRIGVIQPSEITTALAATGGFDLGCPCAIDSPVATVTALAGTISYILSGQAASGVILPLVTAFAATGGWVFESPGTDTEAVFEAWVLNGQAFEPSVFSKFRFNSFAQRGAQTYAAGEYGIYLLGGDDDDGEAFHTGARIGPVNFGADREKRLRGIQMGKCGPDTKVRVVADDGDGGEGVFTPDIDPNRVVASRNIQGREFMIDIQDFQELSHLEIVPLKLARR